MERRPLVSIIVPVYKAEAYLERCLDSIRAQTWPDIEVWLVNDASPDGSLAICRRFAGEDDRFRVLDLPHGGVSAARNAAMDRASGQYLQFVDGDDYLPPDSTEILVREAEATGADLTIAHFYRVYGKRTVQKGHIRDRRVLTLGEYAQEMCKAPANYYYGVLWNKLYRRSVVEAAHLRCAADLSWCEDFLFNLEYLRHVRLAAAVPKPVYYYVKHEDSLVNTQTSLRRVIEMKRTTFAYYKRLYQELDLYEKQKLQVYRYLLSSAVDGLPFPDLPAPAAKRHAVPDPPSFFVSKKALRSASRSPQGHPRPAASKKPRRRHRTG